ncbi:hypothetical protein Tco_0502595 [Tanacetum coccineum]
MLEAILNTLLMNDKSKDTAKARQDLQMLGIRSGLWLGQTKNRKCLKPQAAYSFTPENRKKFCQYIKGVKLPDGFGSCFKHKVTDNDTNITGLKSHDCHIMMQRLLPYGLQNYLPDKIAKPIIDLCSLFKQICSATLMEDDMLKAQIKVVDILCELELIYPPALFDIMVHLVIHLPIEALEGGPIRPRWMYPFERYMKKLKGYVRNKAKPEGSIAEGYVAEEALTFSSHYFRDVTTKFNRPDRNVDPPPPTCRFQVFRSVCKPIGLRSFIRFDAQELKKVKWYVLHNSPEIDTYRSQFKSLFPNKDMQEEFPDWFGSQIRQRHVDNDQDPEVSTTNKLFALANGPSWTPISINSCIVDGVRYVVHSRDERRTTQNSGICSPGPDGEMYYGQLQEIIEFKYLLFKVALFRMSSADVARSHGGDGGGDDRPLSHVVTTGYGGCFAIKGQRSVNCDYPSAGEGQKERKAGIDHFRDWDPCLTSAAHCVLPAGRDLRSINQHLQKATIQKLLSRPLSIEGRPHTGLIDCGVRISAGTSRGDSVAEWISTIQFWMIPRTCSEPQNRLERPLMSVVISDRDPGRWLAFEMKMRQASVTQEYPSLIDTSGGTHMLREGDVKRIEATGE